MSERDPRFDDESAYREPQPLAGSLAISVKGTEDGADSELVLRVSRQLQGSINPMNDML